MNNIIKRRKTSQYLQLHNFPVQEDLDDLSAIGLLTYIMSLPENWELHKTHLQNKFSRRKVDGAWKILTKKKYVVGFIAYVDRKKSYFYEASDIAFTEEEYLRFVDETLKEILEKHEFVSSLKEIPDSPFTIPEIHDGHTTVQNEQYTTVQIEQYKQYSSIRTVQMVQIQKKYKQKKYEQINNNKENNIVNLQGEKINNLKIPDIKNLYINESNNFYNEFAIGRWSKNQWKNLIESFVDETIEKGRYKNVPLDKIKGYVYASIKKMAYHYDYKKGKIEPNIDLYSVIKEKENDDNNIPY